MANGETRSFLIQFMAETGDAVTAMNWLGRSMQKFPSQALNAAAETEVAMAEVETAINEAGASVGALSDEFNMMGRDAAVMLRTSEMFAKMGIEGEKNLVRLTEASRKFGIVTKMSTEAAGGALSDLGLALGYKTPEEVERLASGMVALSQRTKITAQELTFLMRRSGAAAKEVGLTEAAVMGLGASLTQAGMQGRRVAGPIGNLVKFMQQGSGATSAMASAVGITGTRLDEFKEAIPDQQVAMFMEGLGKMDKIAAEETLKGLGIASGDLATKFYLAAKQSQNFNKYLGWASEGMEKNTALADEAASIEETLTYQLKDLWEQLKAIYQMAGKMLVPVVKVFVMALRGALNVIMVIPRPVLALAAAFSALGAAILLGTWASQTKLVISSIAAITTLWAQTKSVGGLTAAYRHLTSTQWAQAASEIALTRKKRLALLEGAGRKYTPMLRGVTPVGAGGANLARAAGTTGMMAGLTSAAGALGISVAALLGWILALVAALIIMGVMIYKGVKMFREGEGSAKAFGAMLLLLTGPIGAFVLGMMLMAKPIMEFKKQITAAIEPLVPLLKKIAPLLYAVGAALLLIAAPFLAPVAAFFAVLYAILPIIVGFAEGFVEVLMWGLEPLIPAGEALAGVFEWIGDALGMAGGEGIGLWDIFKILGKVLAYTLVGPILLPIKAIGWLIDAFKYLVAIFMVLGVDLIAPFVMMRDAIGSAWDWIVGKVKQAISKIVAPLLWLKFAWGMIVTALTSGTSRILGPLRAIADSFSLIWSVVRAVKENIFGSSMFHIQEGVGDVIPSLRRVQGAFSKTGEAAYEASLPMAAPAGAAVGGAAASVAAMAAMRYPRTAAPAAPAAAPAGVPSAVRVSIPVTVQLDGMTLGRAVVEQIIELGERNMNPPGYPMRGVEPAFG